MDIHQGKLLREALRATLFTPEEVATALRMQPEELTAQLESAHADPAVLLTIGRVIGYDFTEQIPALATHPAYRQGAQAGSPADPYTIQLLQQRYYRLLARYNQLLASLFSLAQDVDPESLQVRMAQLLASLDHKDGLQPEANEGGGGE